MNFENLIDSSKELTKNIEVFPASIYQQIVLDPLFINITIFALSCLIGYFVVWNVTPALHSPLMSVTNAISSVIIVGAMVSGISLFPIFLASINIVGGFYITHRMLLMFKKK